MDIQIAHTALKKVAERNGVPLDEVLECIQAAIQQSALNVLEGENGNGVTPAEVVALLGDTVFDARCHGESLDIC